MKKNNETSKGAITETTNDATAKVVKPVNTESPQKEQKKEVVKVKSAKKSTSLMEAVEKNLNEIRNFNDVLDNELSVIKNDLDKINSSTIDIKLANYRYNINTGVRVKNIIDLMKVFSDENKMVQVHTSDGMFKSDLCRSKTKKNKNSKKIEILGFWDFLEYEGKIAIKTNQIYKFGRIGTNFDFLNSIDNEVILYYNLDNLNNTDKLLSRLNAENLTDLDGKVNFVESLLQNELPLKLESSSDESSKVDKEGNEVVDNSGWKRETVPFFNENAKINVSLFVEHYGSIENGLIKLMGVLLEKYDSKLTPTQIRTITERSKQRSKSSKSVATVTTS
jgi:hypothetical protein